MKNSVTIKEMTRAEENHMIRTNEIVTLYHGSKSGIRGILDEQKLTEDDRKKLKQESEANRSKGIAMADEICRKYRRDRMQWAGEEYILEELNDEVGGLKKTGISYSMEVMYWSGYTYRYWHYYTGECSNEIYKAADAETMNECWPGFHTLDVEMAIDDLKEIYEQKRDKECI